MKKMALMGVALVLGLVLSMPALHAQQQEAQQQQQATADQGGWYCPRMGQGMQAGQAGRYCPWYGSGKGRGMMHHRGYGMRHHGPGYGARYALGLTPGQPLTEDQAKTLLENYLQNTNNPNLKLGALSAKDQVYEAEIVTKDGSLVDKIQVDKNTGWFRSAY